MMTDNHKTMLAFHDEEVTLAQTEQDEMRERRDANRNRIENKDGIKPSKFKSQGSYAMHTMVQQPDKDYDIDDGAYFEEGVLDKKTPEGIKKDICTALQNKNFKKPPEVCKKCVRIYYEAGYHVDIPVYKTITKNGKECYELAGDEAWEESDPTAVTDWFCAANKEKSPYDDQLRRITRLLKAFSRSREEWRENIATGFMISKLVVDCYQANGSDSESLKTTMIAIRNSLNANLEIYHPITPNEKLTEGDKNKAKAEFFLEKLKWAIEQFDTCADESEAWNAIFNVTFFCDDGDNGDGGDSNNSSSNETKSQPTSPVNKRGGGTYA